MMLDKRQLTMAQLDLRPNIDALTESLLERCREVVDHIGLKQVAYDLDIQASVMAHALEERSRHHLRPSHLVYLGQHTDALAAFFAELRGLDVIAAKPRTPEEDLADLKAAIDEELGPTVRAALLTRARARRSRGDSR